MVYKIKRKHDGSLERFKARLVAKGFDQKSGVDFSETFSPIIKPTIIRVVLALAVHFNWNIWPRMYIWNNHGNLLILLILITFASYTKLFMVLSKHLGPSLPVYLKLCLILDFTLQMLILLYLFTFNLMSQYIFWSM